MFRHDGVIRPQAATTSVLALVNGTYIIRCPDHRLTTTFDLSRNFTALDTKLCIQLNSATFPCLHGRADRTSPVLPVLWFGTTFFGGSLGPQQNSRIMAPKRPLGDGEPVQGPQNKKRKGFSVGPANLPDGTYRRKSMCIPTSNLRVIFLKLFFFFGLTR